MSAMQRTKGASYEREVVNDFKDALGDDLAHLCSRSWELAQVKGQDVRLPGFAPELKRYALIGKIYLWMKQAIRQAKNGDTPIVICRADREESLVIMRLSDWIKLAREEIVARS